MSQTQNTRLHPQVGQQIPNDIQNNQYELVIIQCCQNCDLHQSLSRHSEWKYFQHFNELKKKIEKYVPNAIVIKNPIPDQLHKSEQIPNLQKNVYINKSTQQRVIFPRIGSFQIYIYNVLISSKLISHQWPHHYKVLQKLKECIKYRREGLSLEQFSVYDNNLEQLKAFEQKQGRNSIEGKRGKKIKRQNSITNKLDKSIQHEQKQGQRRKLVISKRKNKVTKNPFNDDTNENVKGKFPNNNNSNDNDQKVQKQEQMKQVQQKDGEKVSMANTITLTTPLIAGNNRFRVYRSREQKAGSLLPQSIKNKSNLPHGRYNKETVQHQKFRQTAIFQKDNFLASTGPNKRKHKLSSLYDLDNQVSLQSERKKYSKQDTIKLKGNQHKRKSSKKVDDSVNKSVRLPSLLNKGKIDEMKQKTIQDNGNFSNSIQNTNKNNNKDKNKNGNKKINNNDNKKTAIKEIKYPHSSQQLFLQSSLIKQQPAKNEHIFNHHKDSLVISQKYSDKLLMGSQGEVSIIENNNNDDESMIRMLNVSGQQALEVFKEFQLHQQLQQQEEKLMSKDQQIVNRHDRNYQQQEGNQPLQSSILRNENHQASSLTANLVDGQSIQLSKQLQKLEQMHKKQQVKKERQIDIKDRKGKIRSNNLNTNNYIRNNTNNDKNNSKNNPNNSSQTNTNRKSNLTNRRQQNNTKNTNSARKQSITKNAKQGQHNDSLCNLSQEEDLKVLENRSVQYSSQGKLSDCDQRNKNQINQIKLLDRKKQMQSVEIQVELFLQSNNLPSSSVTDNLDSNGKIQRQQQQQQQQKKTNNKPILIQQKQFEQMSVNTQNQYLTNGQVINRKIAQCYVQTHSDQLVFNNRQKGINGGKAIQQENSNSNNQNSNIMKIVQPPILVEKQAQTESMIQFIQQAKQKLQQNQNSIKNYNNKPTLITIGTNTLQQSVGNYQNKLEYKNQLLLKKQQDLTQKQAQIQSNLNSQSKQQKKENQNQKQKQKQKLSVVEIGVNTTNLSVAIIESSMQTVNETRPQLLKTYTQQHTQTNKNNTINKTQQEQLQLVQESMKQEQHLQRNIKMRRLQNLAKLMQSVLSESVKKNSNRKHKYRVRKITDRQVDKQEHCQKLETPDSQDYQHTLFQHTDLAAELMFTDRSNSNKIENNTNENKIGNESVFKVVAVRGEDKGDREDMFNQIQSHITNYANNAYLNLNLPHQIPYSIIVTIVSLHEDQLLELTKQQIASKMNEFQRENMKQKSGIVVLVVIVNEEVKCEQDVKILAKLTKTILMFMHSAQTLTNKTTCSDTNNTSNTNNNNNNNKSIQKLSLLIGLNTQEQSANSYALYPLLKMKLSLILANSQINPNHNISIENYRIMPLSDEDIKTHLQKSQIINAHFAVDSQFPQGTAHRQQTQLDKQHRIKQQTNKFYQNILNTIQQNPYIQKLLRHPQYLDIYLLTLLIHQASSNNQQSHFLQQNLQINQLGKWSLLHQLFQVAACLHNETISKLPGSVDINRTLSQLKKLALNLFSIKQSFNQNPQQNKQLLAIKSQQHLSDQNYKNNHMSPEQSKFIEVIKQFKLNVQLKELQNCPINLSIFELIYKNIDQNQSQANKNQLDLNIYQILSRNSLFFNDVIYEYLLVEGFVEMLIMGFNVLDAKLLVNDYRMMELLREKCHKQPAIFYSLINVIKQSQQYPALSQQSSTAMTLLCHLNPKLSNLNFDDCHIPHADISRCTFYNCSFKNTNLSHTIMYKTSFLNCLIDTTLIENINPFVRSYSVDYTPMCCAISKDNKIIVLGCGNYLLIINSETGKDIKRIQAHGDLIRTVKFSKDGKQLISIADDKTLRTWDTQTFKSVVIKLPQNNNNRIFFSNETQTIAIIINKKQLKLWNLKSMTSQLVLVGHTDELTSVSFSHNGDYVLTGSKDKTVRLWSLKGKLIHTYSSHQKDIICAKISPSNAYIVSSSKDMSLIIHNTLTEQIILKRQFPHQITEICPDLRQKFICVTFLNQNTVTVIDFNTLEVLHQLQDHKQKIISIQYDHSFNKLLSLSKDRTVRFWDLAIIMDKELASKNVNNKRKIPQGSILAIAYDKVNNCYATGHQNGQINIWNDRTNFIIHKLLGHKGKVNKLEFDSKGTLYSGGQDGILKIWNAKNFSSFCLKNPIKQIQAFTVQMLQMKLNERSNMLAMSSQNSQLKVYDLQKSKLLMSTINQKGKILSIVFNNDGKQMAIGGMERVIVTYKIENDYVNGQNTLTRNKQLGSHPDAIKILAYQGESLIIAALGNGHMYVWNHLKQNLIKKIQNTSIIRSLNIFNKKYICLGSEDGKIRMIDLVEGREVKVFRYKSACSGFVVVQPQNSQNKSKSTLVTIYQDGKIIKWNIQEVQDMQGNNKKMNSSANLLPEISSSFINNDRVRYGPKAVSSDGSVMVQVQSERKIRVMWLNQYRQEIIQYKQCPELIKGVQIIDTNGLRQQQKISKKESKTNKSIENKLVFLLRSGRLWSPLNQNQSIHEPTKRDIKGNQSQQNGVNSAKMRNLTHINDDIILGGELVYIKDSEGGFFRSNIGKLLKHIKQPVRAVVSDLITGG